MILTSSGTSSLEASMLNIANPDDHIVIIVSGAFGNRFKQIAETYYQTYISLMLNGDRLLMFLHSSIS